MRYIENNLKKNSVLPLINLSNFDIVIKPNEPFTQTWFCQEKEYNNDNNNKMLQIESINQP